MSKPLRVSKNRIGRHPLAMLEKILVLVPVLSSDCENDIKSHATPSGRGY
jgi:hypothetical protein